MNVSTICPVSDGPTMTNNWLYHGMKDDLLKVDYDAMHIHMVTAYSWTPVPVKQAVTEVINGEPPLNFTRILHQHWPSPLPAGHNSALWNIQLRRHLNHTHTVVLNHLDSKVETLCASEGAIIQANCFCDLSWNETLSEWRCDTQLSCHRYTLTHWSSLLRLTLTSKSQFPRPRSRDRLQSISPAPPVLFFFVELFRAAAEEKPLTENRKGMRGPLRTGLLWSTDLWRLVLAWLIDSFVQDITADVNAGADYSRRHWCHLKKQLTCNQYHYMYELIVN